MVVKRGTLLAVASALVLMLTAATPLSAATREAKPSPLRAANLLRVKDIAANGVIRSGIVAVGYQEASRPGQLHIAWSVDGGQDYRRNNGKFRRYRVVGDPRLGLSTDICAGRVWVGTAWRHPNDRPNDSDVILTSRTISGGAAQAFGTKRTKDHAVRDVTITCVTGKLLAIGWLQKNGKRSVAKLQLRTVEPLGTKPAYKRTFNLGPAEYRSGIAVASTPDQVAVAFARNGDLRLHRLAIEDGRAGSSSQKKIVWNDVRDPVMAARGDRLVVAYSDAGKVKAKLSDDLGASVGKPQVLARSGNLKNPSRPFSIAVVGKRIVSTAAVYDRGRNKLVTARISSSDFGESWKTRTFGNVGARVAALLKVKGQAPALMEAWHNNAPRGSADTVRARYELR